MVFEKANFAAAEETVYFTQNDPEKQPSRKQRNCFFLVPVSVLLVFILGFLFYEKVESQLSIQKEKIESILIDESSESPESEGLAALLRRVESIENTIKKLQESTTMPSATKNIESSVSPMNKIAPHGRIDPDPTHAMLKGVVGMPNETMYFLPRVRFEPLQNFQSESVISIGLDGSLGRTFNKIKVVCKMCLMALRTNSWMYLSPRDRMIAIDELETPLAEIIDIEKLVEGCPFWTGDSPPRHDDKVHMSLRNAYFSEWDISFAESGFFRLATPIRMEVETWLQNQNLDKPLIGIHKRWLDGYCQDWILKTRPAINPRICAIDYEFTIHMLKKFKLDPQEVHVFVAWDRVREEEYDTFKNFGDRLVQIPPHWNLLHETWLLVHSEYFFINSASSIDQLVVEWRKAFNPSGTFVLEWITDDCKPIIDGKVRAKLRKEQPSYFTCPDKTS